MARVLGVSSGEYYAWERRKAYGHGEEDADLADAIRRIFEEYHGRYENPGYGLSRAAAGGGIWGEMSV